MSALYASANLTLTLLSPFVFVGSGVLLWVGFLRTSGKLSQLPRRNPVLAPGSITPVPRAASP